MLFRSVASASASVVTDGVEPRAAEGSVIDWSAMSLVGETGYDVAAPLTAYNPHGPDAVIDQDVLWSCTTCGACMQECPVDIEHVDTIVDVRRNLVMAESQMPPGAAPMLRNLEATGNPWGRPQSERTDWAAGLDVPVLEEGDPAPDYLYWVGCAGAFDDLSRRIAQSLARLLARAGLAFAILGPQIGRAHV